MSDLKCAMCLILAFAVAIGLDYILALAGEPQSIWFMRLIGLMN